MALRSACILFPFLSTHVNHCQHTSTNASLWYLGKPWISVTVEIRMKNMDKNRYLQIRSGKYTKTKVADIQWLYSKWLWLITAVYKPSFADAAYRTTWMWKSCVLNGRKAFSRLFFRTKTVRLPLYSLEPEPTGKLLFPSEVHLFSIRCEGTKISGIFTNWCQLKARCSHEDFAAKRKNRCYHWWTSVNRLVCLAKPFFFFPLFWLYFIRRIYGYGNKVKETFLWQVRILFVRLTENIKPQHII